MPSFSQGPGRYTQAAEQKYVMVPHLPQASVVWVPGVHSPVSPEQALQSSQVPVLSHNRAEVPQAPQGFSWMVFGVQGPLAS